MRLPERALEAICLVAQSLPTLIHAIGADVGETDIFWSTGDLTYNIIDRYERVDYRQFDVRFEPDAVRDIVASAAKTKHENPGSTANKSEAAAPEAKGGRPRKEFWDNFWIEICRQIYEGDLKPKSQAELERAMHEWVGNNGYDAGETVIKGAARKLFKAWKLGVGN